MHYADLLRLTSTLHIVILLGEREGEEDNIGSEPQTHTHVIIIDIANIIIISFWSYYNAWRNSPYNQSYTPGWGEAFGGRIRFQDNDVKDVMVEGEMHWVKQKQIWHSKCL